MGKKGQQFFQGGARAPLAPLPSPFPHSPSYATEECVSSPGLKRHTTLKHVQEEVTPKEEKNILITIDEFINIVKKCSDLCNKDLCLPEIPERCFRLLILPLTVRAVLKPLVEKFYGNAENYYSNFYGSL